MFHSIKSLITLAVLSTALLSLDAKAESLARLTSQFSGITAHGTLIKIKQGPGKRWTVERILPCESFPCDIKNQTRSTVLTPKYLSSPDTADGNTVISLGEDMTLTHVNKGFEVPAPGTPREKSYWKLDLKPENEETQTIKMEHEPKVEEWKAANSSAEQTNLDSNAQPAN
jgi:hypothetical protein